jgi:hypothetical protein
VGVAIRKDAAVDFFPEEMCKMEASFSGHIYIPTHALRMHGWVGTQHNGGVIINLW